MGRIPPRSGLNKGTKVPTIDVATQGCDNIKFVMYKTAPREFGRFGFGCFNPGRYLGGYSLKWELLSTQAITG